MNLPHEFVTPRVVEIIIPHYVPDHDDFIDSLIINYEAIEPENVALFALHLIGKDKKPAIDTSGMEFVPECGELKAPPVQNKEGCDTSTIPDNVRHIQFPLFDNVLYLDKYRGKFY